MNGSINPSFAPRETGATVISHTEALLVFRVGTVQLGVPAELVQEICDLGDASPIPLVPAHIVGLMPLRGEAIPLLDLHLFLQLAREQENADIPRPTRVLVASAEGLTAGLCVDRVLGVEHLGSEQMVAPRIHVGSALAPYVTAECEREAGVLARLNLGALLKSARMPG